MRKKNYLKKTKNFLQTNFPENLTLFKKKNEKIKKKFILKYIFAKKIYLKNFEKKKNEKNKHILFKHNVFKKKYYCKKNIFNLKIFPQLFTWKINKKRKFIYNKFYFSLYVIKKTFEKKKTNFSNFKLKLKEKQKLFFLYGYLSNKYLEKIYFKAKKLNGNLNENVIHFLEKRLDVILYRAFFFSSIFSAKKNIKNKKILVNNLCVNIPSFTVCNGDVISLHKNIQKNVFNDIIKYFLKYNFSNKKSSIFNVNFVFYLLKKMRNKKTFSKQTLYNFVNFFSKKKLNKNYKFIYINFFEVFSYKNFLQNLLMKNFYIQNYLIKKFIYIFLHKKFFIYNKKIYYFFKYYIFFFSKLNKIVCIYLNTYNFNYLNKKNNLNVKKTYLNLHNAFLSLNNKYFKNKFFFNDNFENKKNIFYIKKIFFFLNYFLYLTNFFHKKNMQQIFYLLKFNKNLKKYIICLYLQNFVNKKIFYTKKLFKKKNLYNYINFLINDMYLLNKFFFKQNIYFLYENYLVSNVNKKNFYLSNFNYLNKKFNYINFFTKNNLILNYIYIFNYNLHKNISIFFKYIFSLFFFKKINLNSNKIKFNYAIKKKINVKKFSYNLNKKNNFMKKNKTIYHYKPLNMEISYKTLTIIYLYPSQKYYFPCCLNIDLIYKK